MVCSNVEMRKRAREVLGSSVLRGEWLYATLVVGIVSAVSYLTSVVSLLIVGILGVAAATYFVGVVRGEARYDSINVAVDGAQKNIGGACITGVLVAIYTMLWSMLFIIPGIIKGLSYSMAYFVRVDPAHGEKFFKSGQIAVNITLYFRRFREFAIFQFF